MKKGEIINGYEILGDATMAGGGMCTWTFAFKDSKEYFIKEFLFPVYPVEGSPGSPKAKESRRAQCESFEQHHVTLRDKVASKCSIGGNLIFTIDFFRSGSRYYKVTEKVDVASLTLKDISLLDLKKKLLILTTVTFSLKTLHDLEIVHGDLKPDNILIKKVDSSIKKVDPGYTTKLIDFDNSFFIGKPPIIAEEVVGDLAYYSPELLRYIKRDEGIKPTDLTDQSDIFALGLIFCKYLTGNFPVFDKDKYHFASVAVNNSETLTIEKDIIPEQLENLLNKMLLKKSSERPNIKEVHNILRTLHSSVDSLDWRKKIVKESDKTGIEKKGLKGTLMKGKSLGREDTTKTSTPVIPETGSRLKGSLFRKS